MLEAIKKFFESLELSRVDTFRILFLSQNNFEEYERLVRKEKQNPFDIYHNLKVGWDPRLTEDKFLVVDQYEVSNLFLWRKDDNQITMYF